MFCSSNLFAFPKKKKTSQMMTNNKVIFSYFYRNTGGACEHCDSYRNLPVSRVFPCWNPSAARRWISTPLQGPGRLATWPGKIRTAAREHSKSASLVEPAGAFSQALQLRESHTAAVSSQWLGRCFASTRRVRVLFPGRPVCKDLKVRVLDSKAIFRKHLKGASRGFQGALSY